MTHHQNSAATSRCARSASATIVRMPERDADVLVLDVEHVGPGLLLGPFEVGRGPLRERDVELAVPGPHGVGLVRGGEALARVLPDGLEHAVAHTVRTAARTVGDDEQRPVGEALEEIQHRERADGLGARDDLGRVEREATGEHRQPREQASLGIRQQLVAPVHRRAERLLARDRRARTTGQEPEAIIEPVEDLLRAQHAGARGRELDRERDAVEPVADRRDRRGRRVVER